MRRPDATFTGGSTARVHVPRWRRLWQSSRTLRDGTRLLWWREVLFVACYYVLYSAIRNANGDDPVLAGRNALRVIHLQESLGINYEATLQHWAIGFKPLIIFCNYFYGSLHFVLTAGVLVFLYRRASDDYPLARNALAAATGIALIGFTFFPLMPPRLLPGHFPGMGFSFVDTMDKYPTIWTFKSGAVNQISNQFAAMPSVHCAWSLWCAIALVPRLRSRWAKILAGAYPVLTGTTIVLTANHYFLDAIAGFGVLGAGYVAARCFTRAGRRDALSTAIATA